MLVTDPPQSELRTKTMTVLPYEEYQRNYDNLELEVEKAKETFLKTMFLDEEEEERLTQVINSAIELGVYKTAYRYAQAKEEIQLLEAQLEELKGNK